MSFVCVRVSVFVYVCVYLYVFVCVCGGGVLKKKAVFALLLFGVRCCGKRLLFQSQPEPFVSEWHSMPLF